MLSPDGETVVFETLAFAGSTKRNNFYLMPLSCVEEITPEDQQACDRAIVAPLEDADFIDSNDINNMCPAFSPDGKWLAFYRPTQTEN